ncbi:MAG: ribonuclease HI [Candidatus Cloacimonadota bacterium]|nr:ribonuclease HI [Candidatus Cloacimonadota bacterium]
MKKIKIFTDGACSGNPGPGGWGAILKHNDHSKRISGYSPKTTNNQMELTAVIKALEKLKESCDIEIYSDSKYVIQGMSAWIFSWKKRGWKNSKKETVKNMDLWKKLDKLSNKHNVKWNWVKGHDGHPENEECDKLARSEIEKR